MARMNYAIFLFSSPHETMACSKAAVSAIQFERHGYFVADHYASKDGAPVFNRAVTLKVLAGAKA